MLVIPSEEVEVQVPITWEELNLLACLTSGLMIGAKIQATKEQQDLLCGLSNKFNGVQEDHGVVLKDSGAKNYELGQIVGFDGKMYSVYKIGCTFPMTTAPLQRSIYLRRIH